jgi:porin
MIFFRLISFLWSVLIIFISKSYAYDITDKFSIGGILAGAYQYQWVDGDENKGRGAIIFRPEFSFRPTEKDEIFATFGFAAGNGLHDVTEFNLIPWIADLEDKVKNINGRNRDYLLTAWYKHTFQFSNNNALYLTGGIIDSRDYVDENAYANDEYTQFMNEALVNGPNGFFPSYDIGGAAEWEIGNFDITALGMNIGENDDGNNYNYLAGQIVYKLNFSFGEGSYRLIVDMTSKDFLDKNGENKERQAAGFLSFDQELGDIFGAWIRFGWQDDKALIDYDALFSGGLNITGKWYGREDDNIGIGYAFLNGKNDFDFTRVAEVYWRFALNNFFAVTADSQYMKDKYDTPDMDDLEGIISGIRMTAEF